MPVGNSYGLSSLLLLMSLMDTVRCQTRDDARTSIERIGVDC